MNNDDRQLLLKDLCARLPYKVKVQYVDPEDNRLDSDIAMGVILDGYKGLPAVVVFQYDFLIENVKPYLRKMSSMTDDDLEEYAKYKFSTDPIWEIVKFRRTGKGFINVHCKNRNNDDMWIFQVNQRSPLYDIFGTDWLNANHFDYRGLIPMGLALEATKDMYNKE